MYRLEKTSRDHDKFLSPSFSSTLLDQIYRSIDEGDTKSGETKFFETTSFEKQTDRKQNKKPRSEKVVVVVNETADNRKSRQQQRDGVDHDQDVLFFSSTSISSDSSSGGFSSSDTDSLSRSSCFAPPWQPKPVRTSASFRMEKEKQGPRVFDGFCRNLDAKQGTEIRGEEAVLIKNKSRALKIYNNLKKVKQPISPGGRLTSFLNSLFATTGNNNVKKKKKKKSKDTCEDVNSNNYTERKANSTCSSVRSCLSKTTSSTQRDIHGLRNGVNKTVRFCQVEEKESSVVEEESAARKFLKEYRNNHHKKNDLVLKDLPIINHDEDDDDVASDASSDLFELDHLAVFGSARYCEELPVYETTRVNTNRAIANGIM